MNIAGFIMFSVFAAFSFWLAYISANGTGKNYKGYQSATATVSHTETHRDRDGAAQGYRYVVIFTDHDGREAVGKSEVFCKKRTLENKKIVEVYYWQKKETELNRKMEGFLQGAMNTIVKTLGGEYQPDPRPQYEIHFCDEQVYKIEKKADKRSAIVGCIFGCIMLTLGVLVLFGKFN